MKEKPVLTTGDIAAHCHVAPETVVNWIKGGKLKAFATPGKHRRIYLDDFAAFLSANDMPPLHPQSSTRHRVLIVDDEPGIVQLITDILQRTRGYQLATATNGFAAGIQLMKFRPDLVVLDLKMPHLDGFKVCQMIKDEPETRHIAVLVLTAYANDENVQRALQCGADYCMSKPFKPLELAQQVDNLIVASQEAIATVPLTA